MDLLIWSFVKTPFDHSRTDFRLDQTHRATNQCNNELLFEHEILNTTSECNIEQWRRWRQRVDNDRRAQKVPSRAIHITWDQEQKQQGRQRWRCIDSSTTTTTATTTTRSRQQRRRRQSRRQKNEKLYETVHSQHTSECDQWKARRPIRQIRQDSRMRKDCRQRIRICGTIGAVCVGEWSATRTMN